jgi:poly(A) polymerase
MIKRLIDRLLGGSAARKPKFGKRQEIGPQEHGIDASLVDERAANVVHTLKEAGHEAYIVGGAVRDLLLGLRPKDFDVATCATTSGARRKKTPRAATSPSTPCTTTRRRARWSTTTAA